MPVLAPMPSGKRAAATDDKELPENTVLLYFGNDWFAENRTSSHHLARQFARRNRVYYLECPGWRAPRGSGRDLKKAIVKAWRFLHGVRRVDERLRVRTLFQFPF